MSSPSNNDTINDSINEEFEKLLKEQVGLAKVVLAPALVDAEFEAIYRQNMPATLAEARLALSLIHI